MVEMITRLCPHCGKELQVPEELQEFSCLYCGQRIILEAEASEEEKMSSDAADAQLEALKAFGYESLAQLQAAASARLEIINAEYMTGFDDLLFHQNFATNRTMLAFCQARFRASRSYGFVNNFGMTFRFDNLLFYKDFTTDGAMFAFRQTTVGTGRFQHRIYPLVVIYMLFQMIKEQICFVLGFLDGDLTVDACNCHACSICPSIVTTRCKFA